MYLAIMWEDDDHLCRLLADSLVDAVGFLPVQRLNRRVDDILSNIHHFGRNVEVIKTGSWAEGFRMKGTDVDRMYIDKTAMVSETPERIPNRFCSIKMVTSGNIPKGYVKLILLTPNKAEQHIQLAVISEGGNACISSKIYITSHVQGNGEIHGPCVRRVTQQGTEQDDAHCLRCAHWPSDAMEWRDRRRSHGWPDHDMVKEISKKGCYVVPIGPKFIDGSECWSFNSMLWRLSFSVAEKRLVFTFNDTQFLVYGIFKLLVKEAFRETHDILCSYYMKTLLFWSIEETPRELWKQERLISCIEVCLKRLIMWVSDGFCPNYFVREHNMFHGKLDEIDRESLFIHLSELYGEGWRCLLRCPSLRNLKDALQRRRYQILEMPNNAVDLDDDFRGLWSDRRNESSTFTEDIEDKAFFSQLEGIVLSRLNFRSLENNLYNTVALLLEKGTQLDYLLHDTVTLYQHKTLQHIAMLFLYKALNDTRRCARFRYRQVKRALDLMELTSSTDLTRGRLTLATAYYCMGYYTKALEIIRQCENAFEENKAVLYISSRYPNQIGVDYVAFFCNGSLSRVEKASMGVSYDFVVFRTMPILPKEIMLEILLVRQSEDIISFPPRPYALFLKALCFAESHNKSTVKTLRRKLSDILPFYPGEAFYLLYTMLAVCDTKLDRYDQAIQNYYFAYWHKKYMTWREKYCSEWDSLNSPLLYVALMLRLHI